MDEEVALVREIGRQRALNRFYRTCHSILVELRHRTAEISDDLLLLLQTGSQTSPEGLVTVQEIANQLRDAVLDAIEVESQALSALEDLDPPESPVSPRFNRATV